MWTVHCRLGQDSHQKTCTSSLSEHIESIGAYNPSWAPESDAHEAGMSVVSWLYDTFRLISWSKADHEGGNDPVRALSSNRNRSRPVHDDHSLGSPPLNPLQQSSLETRALQIQMRCFRKRTMSPLMTELVRQLAMSLSDCCASDL